MLNRVVGFIFIACLFSASAFAGLESDIESELVRMPSKYLPENAGQQKNCGFQAMDANISRIAMVAAQALSDTNPCRKFSHEASGKYSYYGKGDGTQGGKTMCGSKFNTNERTIALPVSLVDKPWTKDKVEGPVKCDSLVQLKDLKTGKVVYARVTDTGGFAKYGRVADVSYKVAQELGYASWTDFKKDPPKLSLRVCSKD